MSNRKKKQNNKFKLLEVRLRHSLGMNTQVAIRKTAFIQLLCHNFMPDSFEKII